MINLLADSRKTDIAAARANLIIARYTAILLLAFAFIGGVLFVSYSILGATMSNAESLIASNDVKADVYSETRQQVEGLSTQLSDARAAFEGEVRYSQVLVKVGQLMPAGTILDSLDLNTAAFNGTPVSIKVYAKSTAEISQAQAQLQGSSLFSQVTLQDTQPTGGIDGYPVVATMTVVFNKAGL